MHHKMPAILVIVFGLLFLFGNMSIVSPETVTMIWPLLVMLAGAMKLTSSKCKCCGKDTAHTCVNCGKNPGMPQ